jgi:four helix bundle suffix protein
LRLWPRDDPRRAELIARRCRTVEEVACWVRRVYEREKSTPSTYAEIAANAALVLIAVASSLLDRQMAAQEKAFEKEGGFTERLYRVRSQRRLHR